MLSKTVYIGIFGILIVTIIVIVYFRLRKDKCNPSCGTSGKCVSLSSSNESKSSEVYRCICGTGPSCSKDESCVDGKCMCGNQICGVNSDTCVDGKCMCGNNSACSDRSDTCTGGKCMCGTDQECLEGETCTDGKCLSEKKCVGNSDRYVNGKCMCGTGPICTDRSDTCTGGKCMCGMKSECLEGEKCVDGKCMCGNQVCGINSNTCADGKCMCGTGPICIGDTDTCIDGKCMCGKSINCSGKSDTCTDGKCMCGTNPECGKYADSCSGGKCMCGTGERCPENLTCVNGKCLCGDLVCNGLSDNCVNDKCVCGTGERCSEIYTICSGGKCKCGDSNESSECSGSDACTSCVPTAYNINGSPYSCYIDNNGTVYVTELTTNGLCINAYDKTGKATTLVKADQIWKSAFSINDSKKVICILSSDGISVYTSGINGLQLSQKIQSPPPYSFKTFEISHDGTLIAIPSSNSVLIYRLKGLQYVNETSLNANTNGSFAISGNGNVIFCTDTVFEYVNGKWETQTTIRDVESCSLNMDGHLMYAIIHGRVAKFLGPTKTFDLYVDLPESSYVKTIGNGNMILTRQDTLISPTSMASTCTYMDTNTGKVYIRAKKPSIGMNDVSENGRWISIIDGTTTRVYNCANINTNLNLFNIFNLDTRNGKFIGIIILVLLVLLVLLGIILKKLVL